MRVRVASGVVTAPSDRFGDVCVVATTERLYREPGIAYPGEQGLPMWDGNPEAFELDPDALALGDVLLAAGTAFAAEGVLAYAFGDYQLWPTELEITDEPQLSRAVPTRSWDEFTVATQNLERLSNRSSDFAERLDKLSPYIRDVLGAPDVLAVQEVEGIETLQDLADRLAADDPTLVFTPLSEDGHTSDLNVGFLVGSTVTVTASYQIGFDERFSFDDTFLNDRPPLVLEAQYDGYRRPLNFTLVVVHQRSLGSIEDPEDGPRVRQKRHEQSVWLANWVQARQTADPEERLILAGDFNAFEFTDGYVDVVGQVTGNQDPGGAMLAVEEIVDPALLNWVLTLPAAERYSFIFGCSAEVLDHALTSEPATPWVRRVAYARGNADAPSQHSTDTTTTVRSSDHDGLVLYLGPRWRRGGHRRSPP
jgi:predicted extracellular nuclease